MNKLIKKVPIPISGLMLGIVSLGNLLGGPIAPILAIVSTIIGLLIILRQILYPKDFLKDMKDPIAVSVAPAFAMALIMLSKYYSSYINFNFGKIIFYLGIIIHLALIIYFSKNFGYLVNKHEVYGSFMIVYGSFGAAAIIAPYYNAYTIGKLVWAFGMLTFFPLLYMVIDKDRHHEEMEEVKMPLFCICAANGGLLLTGYYNSFNSLLFPFVIFMIVLGQLVYFLALSKLPKYLRLPFYPSFSSFTFPFVINATALTLTGQYLTSLGYKVGFIGMIALVETIIASILVAYVFIRYMIYLFTPEKRRRIRAKDLNLDAEKSEPVS